MSDNNPTESAYVQPVLTEQEKLLSKIKGVVWKAERIIAHAVDEQMEAARAAIEELNYDVLTGTIKVATALLKAQTVTERELAWDELASHTNTHAAVGRYPWRVGV